MLYRGHSASLIEATVGLALENGISNSQGIRHMLAYSGPEPSFEPLAGWPATMVPNVALYGQLG